MPPANCVSRRLPNPQPPFHPTAFQPSANSCPAIDSTSNRTTAYKLTPERSDFFPSILEEPSVSRWEQVKLTHGIALSLPLFSLFPLSSLVFHFFPAFTLAPILLSTLVSSSLFTANHRKSFI